MASETRTRQGRPPTTPQNSAAMGFILVIAGVVVALLLFYSGGGNAAPGNEGRTAAEIAAGESGSTTTTSGVPVLNVTPPAALELTVGNGSGVAGRGKETAERLAGLGYALATAVDGKPTAVTTIYAVEGAQDDGVAIATAMGLPTDRVAAMPAESPLKVEVGTARVVALVGTDFDPDAAVFGAATQPSAG